MKTLEERKAILNAVIIKHQKNGWQVVSQTDTTCQISKEKKPDTCLVVLLIILFVIPGILYLIFSKGIINIYIEVDEEGKVKYSGKNLSPYQLSQLEKESGDIDVVQVEKAVSDEKTSNLGLLTTKNIADGLNITEEEVIKLIETNQLKGKKVGEKYFVTKNDFDAFMKE